MDEVKLLPCPFCDGEAQLRDPHAAFSHLAAVFCNECEIRGQLSVDAEQAIIFWNTRSTLVTDELVERVRNDIGYHAEQLATYIAQSSISEKNLASARFHNNKIRAAIAAVEDGNGHSE